MSSWLAATIPPITAHYYRMKGKSHVESHLGERETAKIVKGEDATRDLDLKGQASRKLCVDQDPYLDQGGSSADCRWRQQRLTPSVGASAVAFTVRCSAANAPPTANRLS
jgi:hypothetical protein